MKDTKIIIANGEGICPHCSKPIKYSIRQTSPIVYWMLKKEDLDTAKKKVRDEISKITFKRPKNKQEMLNWLMREDVTIGPDEADSIVEQTKKEEEETK